MSRYAMQGRITGDLLTHDGRVIVHHDRAEMEYLFPSAKVVKITDGDLGQSILLLRDHPDLASTCWPLRREDFVHHG